MNTQASSRHGGVIDVIVPVYRDFPATRRCLESVLASREHCREAFEIVVIDDASPEPALSRWLGGLAETGAVTLRVNAENRGFVHSVNVGMALHPGRDVVLLNSDTEVANDWLDRLAAAARRSPRTGTVTPFSNNATICSYPFDGWEGGVPGGLGLAGLDRLFARTLAGRTAVIPTAVGSCMFIRRACLEAVGGFDEAAFGRGYGEENDFSRRAVRAGWDNRLAADVFVFHAGGASFGEARFGLQADGMSALERRHPDYRYHVKRFVEADPLRPLRNAIDRARLDPGGEEARAVRDEWRQRHRLEGRDFGPEAVQLHVGHGWGGGIEGWVQGFCRADAHRRNLVLRSRTDRNAAGFCLELLEPARGPEPLMRWTLATPIRATDPDNPEYAAILRAIRLEFDVGAVIVSSLIGHSLEVLRTGLPTMVVLHDLYPFCPALFAHVDGHECSRCELADLARCHTANPRHAFWHSTDPAEWPLLRKAYLRALRDAEATLVAPSRSVRERWCRLLPGIGELDWRRIPHGIDRAALGPPVEPLPRPAGAGRRLRVVIPGRLAPHKGLELVTEMIETLAGFADILLLGSGDFGEPFRGIEGVEVRRDYPRGGLGAGIAGFRPDCALLLSTLPESFSYTLSEMWALGVPVVATDMGAFAERIEEDGNGWRVAPRAGAVVDRLQRLAEAPEALARVRARILRRPPESLEAMVAAYRECLPLAPPRHDGVLGRGALEARAIQRRGQGRLLAEKQAVIDRLEGELAGLRRLHREAMESRSWRLTRPLRRVTEWLRRKAPESAGPAPAGAPADAARATAPVAPADLRWRLGLADATRVVLVTGRLKQAADVERLVERMEGCVRERNAIAFVLADMPLDDPAWAPVRTRVSALAARRRLFDLPSGVASGEAVAEAVEGVWGLDDAYAGAKGYPAGSVSRPLAWGPGDCTRFVESLDGTD